jgi:hypothetical protein
MATLNKITVASEMFMEAHRRFWNATQDTDYIVSIMMAGSVIGIVGPLLTEQGGHTSHSILARISNHIAEAGTPPSKEGMFRAIYNCLKHSGDKARNILPSSDLFIEAHLEREAAHMLDDAKADFRQVSVSGDTRATLSAEFLIVLESDESYA